jgi:thymidylate synthase
MSAFRNAEHALIVLAREVMAGPFVEVRGSNTRELIHQTVTLARPLERTIVVPARHNNVFAAIAETMWVIAGRSDIDFVTHYVPRAPSFSDDGLTWRGGYGPRLRDWNGIDQLAEVIRLLRRDPSTRQAVLAIFDPDRDYVDSRDIPCTNWMHFMIRDGVLHLEVAVRSNDLFWGFSGINTFEWSVLHEMVAHWTETVVGSVTFYISSLHLYERHFDRATDVAACLPRATRAPGARFGTAFDGLATELDALFTIETQLRLGNLDADLDMVADPLLRDFAAMLRAYGTAAAHGTDAGVNALAEVASADLVEAGRDYFAWAMGAPALERTAGIDLEAAVRQYMTHLHRGKDAAYGDSWKRRGEQIGIMANLARKYDRLANDNPYELGGEGLLDTVTDLAVYAIKYQAYLRDAISLPGGPADQSWSDGPQGFEQLLGAVTVASVGTWEAAFARVATEFEAVEASLRVGDAQMSRLQHVDDLAAACFDLVMVVAAADPALLMAAELGGGNA